MKKFKYLLLIAFLSSSNFANGQCGKNEVAVVNTQFKGIHDQYLLVFGAYKNDNGVKMSTTVAPFFKKYETKSQISNPICVDKQELKKCIADFQKILTKANDLPHANPKDGRNRFDVLTTVINQLEELETDNLQNADELSSQPSTTIDAESPIRENSGRNTFAVPPKKSFPWTWFAAFVFCFITIGLLGIWGWFMWSKQRQTDQTLKGLSDRLHKSLKDNDASYVSQSHIDPIQRIDLLVSSLMARSSSHNKDKQEVVWLKQELERRKKVERDLVGQIEGISSEFDNYKNSVAKSMGNKTSLAPDKLGTFLQNFEQTPLQPTKQFYLSYASPSSDGMGEFYDKRQPQPNSANSYYRFEMEPDEVNAKFWFHDTAGTVEGATRNPDTYLSPACEYSAVDPKAKHILTKKEGVAKRTGDVWKVYRKAVIEFS